jgi:hypothetical protein
MAEDYSGSGSKYMIKLRLDHGVIARLRLVGVCLLRIGICGQLEETVVRGVFLLVELRRKNVKF